MRQTKKQEYPGQGLEMWGRVLQGEEKTAAGKDSEIAEQVRLAREANNTELARQIIIFRQEVTGVREQLIEHRRTIANLINELKQDVSTRLLNFTSEYDFLTFKKDIEEKISEIQERLGE